MNNISNWAFTYTIPQIVQDAVLHSDPIKVTEGWQLEEIQRMAEYFLGTFVEENVRKLMNKNLCEARVWKEQNPAKKLRTILLEHIFYMSDTSQTEESLKFYFACGGYFSAITTFIQSAWPKHNYQQVRFLDLIRRCIDLEKEYIESIPPITPGRENFFSSHKSSPSKEE